MKRYMLFILLSTILIWSCNEPVYKSYQELPGNRWNKNDVRIFTMEVTDDVTPYQLNLEVQHANSILVPSIKMAVQISSLSGQSETHEFEVMLKDANGDFKGDGAGDIWDYCCTPLSEKKTWQKGTYKIGLTHLMDYEYIPGVMGIGIRLDK